MSLFVIAVLASIGMPGTSGAPGELLILAAAFGRSPGIGLLAALVIVVSAVYGLGLIRGIFFGPSTGRATDIGWRERALVIPLLVLVIAVGVAPRVVGDLAERPADAPVGAR